jgi:hypothetical protein
MKTSIVASCCGDSQITAVSSIVLLHTLLLLPTSVDAGAVLALQMVQYSNPSSKDWDGACCDPFCWSACDHIFHFSLDLGNSDDNSKGTYYWSQTSGTFQDQNVNNFGADIAGVSNPIVYIFLPQWPGSVKFKVYVEDDDSPWTGNDPVDGLIEPLTLTPSPSQSLASYTTAVVRGVRPSHKTSLTMNYMLYCQDNYYSSDCSVYCVASDSDSGGHYTCDPATGGKVCRTGWEDPYNLCKTFSNDCVGVVCQNGGTCVDGVRSYTCSCQPGFTGRNCETNINECLSSPCQNNGICSDRINGFSCTCPASYVGPICSVPYCQSNNPCRNGGTCYGPGSCQCIPGFTGPDCSIDLCQTVHCRNGGTCRAGVCFCPSTFTGPSCDLVQCTNLSYCLNGGVCYNGSCNCSLGFTGNHCEININDCEVNPCENNGACTDLINGFICTCPASYVGPTCSVPYCQSSNPCHNGGACYGPGSCRCPPGYVGPDCSVDRCDVITCHNGGSCQSGFCVCPAGVVGETCDVILCDVIKCQNGGRCDSGSCRCPSGFTGSVCDVNIDDCVGSPCKNDGTCDDLVNGFLCRCLPGYGGLNCVEPVQPPTGTASNNATSSAMYIADQPGSHVNPLEAWFYTSFCIIFVLLLIIIAMIAFICLKRRRGRLEMIKSISSAEVFDDKKSRSFADDRGRHDCSSCRQQ